MNNYLVASCLILASGAFVFLFPKRIKGIAYTVLSGLAMIFAYIPSIEVIISGSDISQVFNLGFPIGSITLAIDPIAAFFIIIIATGNFLVGFYSIGYMKSYLESRNCSGYYFLLSVLFLSMLLLVGVQNSLAFLVLWEIMSLSSFFLVSYERGKKEIIDSAVYYLIAMQLGFVFILAGFTILSLRSGSFDFKDFKDAFSGDTVFSSLVFILFFIGFGTKCGFIPFHTWLPKAHPAAPTPVSAAMSGVMIKTGVFGIIRIITFMGQPPEILAIGVIVISLLSAVFGIIGAILQHDMKKLLAYSSIENMGIIGLGLGVGMLGLSLGNATLILCGFAGALLHVANHFLFKSLLFFGAGVVYHKTKTRNMDLLGGLIKTMPATSLLFLIGSIAISGLPPFNGFASEFSIYFGFLKGITGLQGFYPLILTIAFAGLAFTGVLALFCFTKMHGIVFLGSPRSEENRATHDASLPMLIPMFILAILIVCIGFFPNKAISVLSNTISSISNPGALFTKGVPDTAAPSSPMSFSGSGLEGSLSSVSFAFIVLGAFFAVIVLLRLLLLKGKRIAQSTTWDCGYQAHSPRLQYSSTSFTGILTDIFGPLLGYKVNILTDERKNETYNKIIHIDTRTSDAIEQRGVRPLQAGIEKLLRFFLWIQSGNTQQYILYGIIFLFVLIIFVFGVKV